MNSTIGASRNLIPVSGIANTTRLDSGIKSQSIVRIGDRPAPPRACILEHPKCDGVNEISHTCSRGVFGPHTPGQLSWLTHGGL